MNPFVVRFLTLLTDFIPLDVSTDAVGCQIYSNKKHVVSGMCGESCLRLRCAQPLEVLRSFCGLGTSVGWNQDIELTTWAALGKLFITWIRLTHQEVHQQHEIFSCVPQLKILVFQSPECLRIGRLGRLWIHGWLKVHPAAATRQRRLNESQRHQITTALYDISCVNGLVPYFAMASPWHVGVGKYSVQTCSDRQCQGFFFEFCFLVEPA